jgi:hypothetical protein
VGVEYSGDGGAALVSDVLEHYGVKGMKWGVRRAERPGAGHPASEDATRAHTLGTQGRGSGRDSLSNRELQDLVTRWNLEQQYDRLRPKTNTEKVKQFLTAQLLGIGKEQVTNLAKAQLNEAVKKAGNK